RSRFHRGGGILRAGAGQTRDEAIHPGQGRLFDRVFVDAAVDLDHDGQLTGVDQPAHYADLRQHLRDELLATETGFNGHDQHRVELAQNLEVGLDRGTRFYREA